MIQYEKIVNLEIEMVVLLLVSHDAGRDASIQ